MNSLVDSDPQPKVPGMTELLNTLYVQTQGASLFLEGDSIRIVIPEHTGRNIVPLRRIQEIVAFGNVNVSNPLLTRCAADARSVTWMSAGGRFLNRLDGPTRGNVLLRHAQHLHHANARATLETARGFVAGKLQNSRQILLKGARDAQRGQDEIRAKAENIAEAIIAIPEAGDLDVLRGIEGEASRRYFEGFRFLLRRDLDVGAFPSRIRRPPTDPINALLSFFYGLTRSIAQGAAEQVGLDPYIGFLHGLRPAKPALALDLMEELRAPIADRLALTLLNRRQLTAEHFETLPGGAVQLTEPGRTIALTAWREAMTKERPHRLHGRRIPTALLPAVQARILARHIRGELPDYMPWMI
ncbi:CRISPR-associated protein Cas4/endonuclease Cas1 fusion [Actinomadura rubteroloni]|uniref:CRISPR-associated endonuclease Cas1 n=1 Tax=Actinomadura rubteroloni TaxID=1926885 RepID=A0A2P4URW1_9ACTN|nr:type I-C CRISPR-associated endonuclease Cas1c [Actinomadura rubteroloni]POM27789.1 CRISPR-associated protein Cas4/endonuclease Cas1 fusion [Actinomadura rubteroloni]